MENQRINNEIEIDLLEIFRVLLSKSWLMLIAGFIAGLACFVFSGFVMAPYYNSTTKIYILNKADNDSVTYNDVQIGTQLTKDYAELINSRYVLEAVMQKLSLEDGYKELLKKVSVSTPTDTRIVSITVEDEDPMKAMEIADCIREMASEHIQNVMDIEAVNVVEAANMPTEKAGPSVLKWTLAGGVIGIFLSGAAVLAKYFLDDTIKSSEDVEKYLGLSTLALVPLAEKSEDGKKKKKKK